MDRFEAIVARRNLHQVFEEPWWQGRAFQLCGRDQLIRAKRAILSLDKGLGKTSTILSIFEDLRVHKGVANYTVVIFTSKRGMTAYTRDIQMFPEHADKIVLVKGTKQERKNLWRKPGVKYFITTYPTFLSDTGSRMNSRRSGEVSESIVPRWVTDGKSIDGVVCDEFHRVFRNRNSATFHLFLRLFRYTEYFIPMSGSAVSKDPTDLWAALHLCDRKFWSSFWKYAYTWCHIDDSGYGRTILGPIADRVEKWRAAVRPYVFHVTAEDVQHELPTIMNSPLDVEMDKWQKELHDSLRTSMYAETPDGEFLFSSNNLSNLFKIRTALICPKALNPEFGYGAGLEAIADDVEEVDLEKLPRYGVLTPFKAPLPYIAEYLRSRGHGVFTLQGGITLEQQEQTLSDWREHYNRTGERAALVSTIKYAESWEAPETHIAYMLGYEWDNEDNDQARKRFRRLISTQPVMINWIRHLGSYDQDFIDLLMQKKFNKDMLLATWNDVDQNITKGNQNVPVALS